MKRFNATPDVVCISAPVARPRIMMTCRFPLGEAAVDLESGSSLRKLRLEFMESLMIGIAESRVVLLRALGFCGVVYLVPS